MKHGCTGCNCPMPQGPKPGQGGAPHTPTTLFPPKTIKGLDHFIVFLLNNVVRKNFIEPYEEGLPCVGEHAQPHLNPTIPPAVHPPNPPSTAACAILCNLVALISPHDHWDARSRLRSESNLPPSSFTEGSGRGAAASSRGAAARDASLCLLPLGRTSCELELILPKWLWL